MKEHHSCSVAAVSLLGMMGAWGPLALLQDGMVTAEQLLSFVNSTHVLADGGHILDHFSGLSEDLLRQSLMYKPLLKAT